MPKFPSSSYSSAAWFVLAVLLCLSGCGGGGGASQPPVAAAATGQVTVALRDVPGDFLRYAVDVSSIRLERRNGDVVETLPLASRVDFAALVQLTEFLTSRTVPVGTYDRIVMSLDYADADIVVENDGGQAVAATAVDGGGNPLGRVDVTLDLPQDRPIRIAQGVPANVTLDFDLAASNDVDLSVAPARVTVSPTLSAVVEFEGDREHRVRGLLAAVDANAQTVTLRVRPCETARGDFGAVTFATDGQTHYEIDGTEYDSAAGFTALAALGSNTPVVALGKIVDGRLVADTVLAGSSVPWQNTSFVQGVVTARNGNVLHVAGVGHAAGAVEVDFARDITVDVADTTEVTAPGLGIDVPAIRSISIGSRITAIGRFAAPAELDATAGRVRLEQSELTARVLSVQPLVVQLLRLDGRWPTAFDFAGTGASAATNSDPAHYEIDPGALPLDTLAAGDIAHVVGRTSDFGSAPPDFVARTVVDVDLGTIPVALFAGWGETGGTAAPFLTTTADRLDVDLSSAGYLLAVWPGVPLPGQQHRASVALLPAPGGVWSIALRGTRELRLYQDYAQFVSALSAALVEGRRLARLHAAGQYNADKGELTAVRANFEFMEP